MSTPALPPSSDGEVISLLNGNLSISFAQKYLRQIKDSPTSDLTTEKRFLECRRQEIADRLRSSLRDILNPS